MSAPLSTELRNKYGVSSGRRGGAPCALWACCLPKVAGSARRWLRPWSRRAACCRDAGVAAAARRCRPASLPLPCCRVNSRRCARCPSARTTRCLSCAAPTRAARARWSRCGKPAGACTCSRPRSCKFAAAVDRALPCHRCEHSAAWCSNGSSAAEAFLFPASRAAVPARPSTRFVLHASVLSIACCLFMPAAGVPQEVGDPHRAHHPREGQR